MMKELNELAYRAKGYLRTKAESQPEQINASCDDILAIFEAFRALDRRAEAAEVEKAGAEERCRMMFDAKNHWADRAREAEAKLAELEKQEPIAHAWDVPKYPGSDRKVTELCSPKHKDAYPVYARPVPAVSLAELVPDAERIHNEFDDWREGWNACRAAILRKIEEAK